MSIVSITDIAASDRLRALDMRELWASRELLYFFVWRDLKVRYKETVLGAAWAVLQPALTMAVFALFLGHFAHMPSDGLPYPLFSYAGLVPWTYFSAAVASGAGSVVGNERLISKVYFPRLLIPFAAAVTPLVDFAIAMVTLIGLLLWYRVTPGVALLWTPLFVLLAVATAATLAVWLSVLTVAYRDFRYIVPFFLQFWMFATPVVYPVSVVPGKWRLLMGLNPMTGVVEGFRWALVGGSAPGPIVLVSAVVVLVWFVGGLIFFRRAESTFADVI